MKKLITSALAGLAATTVLTASPAAAGPATGSVDVGTNYGPVLRNEFRQNADGSGYSWQSFGSGNCTSSTTDVDFGWSNMDSHKNWNDVVSYAKDFAQCDTKLYANTGFASAMTGWVNYGSGSSVGSSLNNRTSSYQLS